MGLLCALPPLESWRRVRDIGDRRERAVLLGIGAFVYDGLAGSVAVFALGQIAWAAMGLLR